MLFAAVTLCKSISVLTLSFKRVFKIEEDCLVSPETMLFINSFVFILILFIYIIFCFKHLF